MQSNFFNSKMLRCYTLFWCGLPAITCVLLLLFGLAASIKIGHLPPFSFLESEALGFPRQLVFGTLMVTLGSSVLTVPWLCFLKYAGFKVAKWITIYLLGFLTLGLLGVTNPLGLLGWFGD